MVEDPAGRAEARPSVITNVNDPAGARSYTIYFVAGERSADNHGAALLKALRARSPQMQFLGRGGPKMRTIAGGKFRDWIHDTAVVGLWEVIRRYPFFRKQFQATISEIDAARPSAVVLIDYPGFNLRLARALRGKFSELKIIYYISPQVWAWNRRRVSQMAQSIDLMLCIFPFEPQLYEESGLRAIFVGHPMTSVIPNENAIPAPREVSSDKAFEQTPRDPSTPNTFGARDENLIGLFPGSREREVKKIFPVMREAAVALSHENPDLRFAVSAASEPLAELIGADLYGKPATGKFFIVKGEVPQLMVQTNVGMVASGTATLEAVLSQLPFVLIYRVAWLTYLAARLVVKIKYLGMPNVLAGREIVPEFIQHQAQPQAIAAAVARLLTDKSERARMLSDFAGVAQKLGRGEAGENAADAIIRELRRAG
ncbi:MAG: lipid-A-disaccharide synthase [Verrucomicrobia bacterium]|nr:MAG: lipid-A-disaccharide synthase [Verrucomicrobiota bacterium]